MVDRNFAGTLKETVAFEKTFERVETNDILELVLVIGRVVD